MVLWAVLGPGKPCRGGCPYDKVRTLPFSGKKALRLSPDCQKVRDPRPASRLCRIPWSDSLAVRFARRLGGLGAFGSRCAAAVKPWLYVAPPRPACPGRGLSATEAQRPVGRRGGSRLGWVRVGRLPSMAKRLSVRMRKRKLLIKYGSRSPVMCGLATTNAVRTSWQALRKAALRAVIAWPLVFERLGVDGP